MRDAVETILSEQVEKKKIPPPNPVRQLMPRKRLLVVEDNTVNQMVARGILEHAGATLDTVADGRQAVERHGGRARGESGL